MAETLEKLEFIAQQTQQDISALLGKATEIGIEQMWIQAQLDLYLRGKISREEAVKAVGEKPVRIAERQRKVVFEDIKWGLGHA